MRPDKPEPLRDFLVPARGLDVAALARLFDDATNSYKHLFFRAILDEFREGGFTNRVFSLARLAAGMLAAAWYPCRVHRLSLGVQDKVAAALTRVDFIKDGLPPSAKVRQALIDKTPDIGDLLRFVPYRLIAPFFARDLKGVPDHRRNVRIRESVDMAFWSVRPLYRFVEGDRIELHPDWADYIAGNFAIVSGWAERRWIAYLQSRNPLAPAVSEKIAAPVTRAPLTFQTSYWRRAIGAMPDAPRCIYSGVVLDPYSFALDHFLPWTFVCHDALWNLAPVLPAANSAKGNRLPHRGYVHGLVALQHRGLVAASRQPVAGRLGGPRPPRSSATFTWPRTTFLTQTGWLPPTRALLNHSSRSRGRSGSKPTGSLTGRRSG